MRGHYFAGSRAEAITFSIEDFPLQILANYRLGRAHFYLGEFTEAGEVFQRNVEALRGDLGRKVFSALPTLPAVTSLGFIGMYRMYQDDFTRALDLMKEAVHIGIGRSSL